MTTDTRNLLKGLAFISPWLIGFTVFTALPIVLSFYFSLCDFSLLQSPAYIGMDNYRELWGDPVFWLALKNTAWYAMFALPMGLIIALMVALLLNAPIRGVSVYRTLVFLPSLVPAVASAMLWLWLFNAQLGLINVFLRFVGVSNPPGWLVDTQWAMTAMILISFWGIGNTVVIFLAGLQDVPKELLEAAELDGAGSLRKVWHVTLPWLSPVIFFNLIIAIIGALRVFDVPWIMTQGGPARSTYFYTIYLYQSAFEYLKMGYASAMAWINLLIVLVLTAIAFWTSSRWVHYQGR